MVCILLEIKKLELSFGNKILFSNLSFKIYKGQIGLISAPSGSGKTTILKWVSGIHNDNLNFYGKLFLNNNEITTYPIEKRKIGILFQKPLLFPNLTVRENLYFGLNKSTTKFSDRENIINQTIINAELTDLNTEDTTKLSAGQQTRVALFRALLSEPDAILLDEPFASLDSKLRKKMFSFVKKQIKKKNIPALITSHDPRDQRQADFIISIT